MSTKLFLILITYILFSQDSIPSWRIVYSKIYHQQFVSENVDFDYQLLQKENAEFHKLVSQYFNTALDLIPLYSGEKWDANYHLDIFPSRSRISFSHPLTLAYHSDQLFMFFTLIHESVHHNLKISFPDSEMEEALCDKIAIKVSSVISKELAQRARFSRYFGFQKMFSWDLDSLNIREWWSASETKVLQSSRAFKEFENRLYHQEDEQALNRFNKVQASKLQFYQEQAYRKLISFFEKKDISKALFYCRSYLKAFPDGAFRHLISFHYANLLLKSDQREDALKLMQDLKSSINGVNNYLDDLYLLLGRLSSGKSDLISAAGAYLYIIERLPNGSTQADAYQNLARIYRRLKQDKFAAKIYDLAFQNMTRSDKKAQLIIEMEQLWDFLDKEAYKNKLLTILQKPLKTAMKQRLEKIFKKLL